MNSGIFLMKKILFLFLITSVLLSCREEDGNIKPESENLYVGNWKATAYEFKGKLFPLNSCENQTSLKINSDLSGTYDLYEPSAGNCIHSLELTGKWVKSTTGLNFIYQLNGSSQELNFSVESVSQFDLKINVSNKDIDGNGSVDEGVLVFIKAN